MKKKKSILVVEDSPVTQKITEKTLSNNGFTVYQAYSGDECLSLAKQYFPDIILMDVILPGQDGKEVVRALKADSVTAPIPIVFTTNTLNVTDDDGSQVFEVDGQSYRAFAKPLHYRKLLSVIRKEINRSIHGGELPPPK